MDLLEIKTEAVEVEEPEVDLSLGEIEIGDFIVKTETDDEDNNEEDHLMMELQNDDELPSVKKFGNGTSTRLSPKQLTAMAEYSAKIGKDLKTRVKKVQNGYSCRICGYSKLGLESMRAHLSSHRDGNPFRCPLKKCFKLYPTHAQLTQHIKLHSPPTKLYRCKFPGCKTPGFRIPSGLKSHKLVHAEVKTFACNVSGCNKRFALSQSVAKHMTTHLNPELREKMVCDYCGMKFLSKMGYFHHVRRHRGIFKEKKYSCYFCDVKWDTPSSREIHLRSHTLEKPFQCGECKIWLASEITLKSHGAVHRETVPFSCSKCPKQFKWKTDLDSHVKLKHDENAEVFQCHECDYRTVRTQDLVRHKRVVHLNLRPHSCSLCPKTFGDKTGLMIHVKMHGIERPFSCKICSKGFVTETKLKYHVQSHSEERKFTCPQCKNKYKTHGGLQYHLKHIHGIGEKNYHKDVWCYFCNKHYTGLSGLVKHLRRHTREKPYQCSEPDCSTTWFTSQENLTYHLSSKHGKGKQRIIRSDTDERFQCPKCSRTYKYKNHCMTHERIAHDKTAKVYSCTKHGCEFTTKNPTIFRQHIRGVHLNITVKCKNCGKAYKKKADLARHSEICME